MRSKKGVEDIVQNILMGAIAGIFFLAIFLVAFKAFGAILPHTGPEAQCTNSQWWENQRGLKDILKSLDSDESTSEFLFYNNNCHLVSFSFTQGASDISYPGIQPREPVLCLCEVDRSIPVFGEAECKPYDCYKFKNYDQINTQQLSTEDLEDYVFLRFTKDGRTLRIENLSTEKQPEPIVYTKPQAANVLDQTSLINRLAIVFTTNQIKNFTPIIKISEAGFILPQDIPNIEGFTTTFDLDLALLPLPGQSIEDYANNHQSIDPNLVRKALIEFSIPKSKADKLTTFQRNSLALYYKKGTSWGTARLVCGETNSEIVCGNIINEFSNKFVISTIKVGDAYTSESETEIRLSSYIVEKSLESGIDPLFMKSIIKIETDWDNRSVSRCGAAGLAQLMPHTARGVGLITILDPVDNVAYNTSANCDTNEVYGSALSNHIIPISDEELISLDERFDEKKAIAASIRYFVMIKNNLERRGIPITNENMAAAYNIGPNDVTGDGQYAKEKGYVYVSRFNEVYNKLQRQVAGLDQTGDIHVLEGVEQASNDLSPENLIYLLDDPEIQQKIEIAKYDLAQLTSGGLGVGSIRPLSQVDTIVLHHTGGYRATTSADGRYPGAIQTLQSRHLSSHYVLDRDGTLHYIVPENVNAFHAGCCNIKKYNTATKEYVSGCCDAEGPTDEADVICKKTGCVISGINSRSIGIEIVNRGELNDPFTDEQYNTLNQLLPYLSQKLSIPYDNQHIIAHYEVTRGKNDPKYLEWSRINLPQHISYQDFNRQQAYA